MGEDMKWKKIKEHNVLTYIDLLRSCHSSWIREMSAAGIILYTKQLT